ncbi:MAG: hypothetical protein ACYDD0_06010, partial [Candidatus Dormibacteria bacterium]
PFGSGLLDHDPLDGRRRDDRFDPGGIGQLSQQPWELVGIQRLGAASGIDNAQARDNARWYRADEPVNVGEAPHLPTFR